MDRRAIGAQGPFYRIARSSMAFSVLRCLTYSFEIAREYERMKNVTVRLDPDLVEELEDEAEAEGTTRTEYMREIIRTRHERGVSQAEYDRLREEYERLQREYDALQEEYEDEVEHLETQIERLQRMNLKILEERDRTKELEVYVDEQRRRKEAGKLKAWWNDLTGWE